MRKVKYHLVLLILAVTSSNLSAQDEPILTDGLFQDWHGVNPLAIDETGEPGNLDVDFERLWVADQHDWLFIRFQTTSEIILQDFNSIHLLIDNDNNPGTGFHFGDQEHGADFIWVFGEREGTFFPPGEPSFTIEQSNFRIRTEPTVSGTDFEVAIEYGDEPDGENPILPNESFSIRLIDDEGDEFPEAGGILYTLQHDEPELIELPIGKLDNNHIRFVTHNILSNGWEERSNHFRRLYQAIQPEILAIQEAGNISENEAEDFMDEWLPLENNNHWNAAKEYGDCILISKWPILESWDIPDARATAFLCEVPAPFASDLFVINAHPPCCDNNEDRQYQIDAIMSFFRDAKEPGGDVELAEGIPVVITGDMNLVGWVEQLTTFLEGEIINLDEFGPSFDPDWDGTGLTDLYSRQPNRYMAYTWRNDWSSFNPGRLDFIIYSDSNLEIGNHFILHSAELREGLRDSLGLYPDDSEIASDHLPVVADIYPLGYDDVNENNRSTIPHGLKVSISPNPSNSGFRINVEIPSEMQLKSQVFDINGRLVFNTAERFYSAGNHSINWNADEINGTELSTGIYFVRISNSYINTVKKAVLIR